MEPIPNFECQQFGTIETSDGAAKATLCVDADRKDEFAIHWWNDATKQGVGVISKAIWVGNQVRLFPQDIYRVNSNGALQKVGQATPEEQKLMELTVAELVCTPDGFSGTWNRQERASGQILLKPLPQLPNDEATKIGSWEEYKNWANHVRIKGSAKWFRGHGDNKYGLRTTLHRMSRCRLERYCFNELVQFALQAEATFNRVFDLNNAHDYATVLGLARHHGMPTPVLDWTASPYIAAFFAFSDALEMHDRLEENSHVRIYALSSDFVDGLALPTIVVPWVKPYVHTLSIGPLHNPRLNAQQGQFLVTNVMNLEAHIRGFDRNKTLLSIIDLPASCATEALRDLAFMGLTAATMFPGLDGVGRRMKHEMSFNV